MNKPLNRKREKEQKLVSKMITIFCRKNHALKGELCPDCEELKSYAICRISHCPKMAEKTFCSLCPTHCYHEEMRRRIQEVMRFSGPRMIFYDPVASLRHLLSHIKKQ